MSADGTTLAVGSPGEDSSATGVNGDQADNSAIESGAVYVFRRTGATWVQAYLKASNTGADDDFGRIVDLSADGAILAVGAYDSSSATGINGNQADDSAIRSGAVYVFRRTGTAWTQEAYLKASNTGAGDRFGLTLDLSADGSTLVAGAVFEASNATGVNGNQADNSATGAGAAYVFRRTGTTWVQEAYLKASNTAPSDFFGSGVALSGDGSILAVGAALEDSAAGINGDQADNSATNAGAVYLFRRTGTTWAQEAYLKASNAGQSDQFGTAVVLSADGSTVAVASPAERSGARGVNGNQADNSSTDAGAVYVFRRTGTTWAQEAYLKASNTGSGDHFGWSFALSADGATLAVGALAEDSNATGINGSQANASAPNSGAVYVFRRTGTTWAQEAYLKASNTGSGDTFGLSVTMSADGATLAVGAYDEDSNATGVNGNQADNSARNAGAVYVFSR